MSLPADIAQWILGIVIVMASLGTILSKKPVHSSIFFLLTLFTLAVFYLQLAAQFIAVMQVLVYAGAILVIFMFVMVLFQDSYQQIHLFPPKSSPQLLFAAAGCFLVTIFLLGKSLIDFVPINPKLPTDFGTTQHLGQVLYIDFFFPFEAVILLFLVAVVGSLYIAKKVK
jgi:NADH-quinone oxidoreductase subunit J